MTGRKFDRRFIAFMQEAERREAPDCYQALRILHNYPEVHPRQKRARKKRAPHG